MSSRRRPGYDYLPGLLYDLAFGRVFRGLRRWVARRVDKGQHYPWLDVCCGTGAQLRESPRGLAVGLDLSFPFVRYAATRAPRVPFVCGDAARLPFRDGSMRAVSVSVGLHDKGPEVRTAILAEARRVLAPGCRLIAVDFERPWNAASRVGALFAWAVERLAGGEHYKNGRDFLRRGGLRSFLRENGFAEVERLDIAFGSIGAVVARAVPARAEADGPCETPAAAL